MSEERTAADAPLPGGDFRLLVTRLSYQALMSLGIIENPLTDGSEVRLDNARMLIDDLAMLRAKTEGNLEPDEAGHLDKILGDLRRAFERVEAAEGS